MRWPFRICLITNRHLVKNRPMIEIVEEALAGGVDCVLLREPDLNPKTILYVGRQFRMLTRRYSAKLIVKDRVDVAMLIDADGVHLGADSIPPKEVRRIWKSLIGYSAHTLEEVRRFEEDVDYFFLSPVYRTKSKPMAKPLGVEYLRNAIINSKKPVYPLGGIDIDKVEELKKAGAEGVAAMSLFFRVPDPQAVACEMKKRLEV